MLLTPTFHHFIFSNLTAWSTYFFSIKGGISVAFIIL